jgi:hypothetical protein
MSVFPSFTAISDRYSDIAVIENLNISKSTILLSLYKP